MSTDSTELTFVRCPSCRSLVPAISTRCRMCGATLEATAAAAPDTSGDQEQRKSGRVRQRTMSEANSEISTAASQVREEPAQIEAPPVVEPVAVKQEIEEPADVDDPLSAYIEEVETKEVAPTPPPVKEPEMKVQPVVEKAPVVSNGMDKNAENGNARHEAPTAPPQKASSAPAFDDDDNDIDPFDSDDDGDEKPQEKAAPAPAPRVVVEPGGRKPGESRLNFGAPRETVPQVEVPVQAKAPEQSAPPKVVQPATPPPARENEIRPIPRPQQNRESGDRRDQQRSQPPQQSRPEQQQAKPRQPEMRDERPQTNSQSNVQPPVQSKPNPVSHPSPTSSQSVSGRLFGWFVNYSDPQGTAVEIREGKFFLSGTSVKPTDLVINDRTISSPHALLTVSPATGLIVQDLMSERGVFVRRKTGDTYKKEEESITLSHGDWVRFGDVEFLISLIAYPGEK